MKRLSTIVVTIFMVVSCGTEGTDNDRSTPEPAPRVVQAPKGERGKAGVQGKDGAEGKAGTPGTSCEVESLAEGTLIKCASSQAVVLNGKDGISPVLEVFEPCKDMVVPFPEIFLKLSDGTMIAYFTDFNRNNHLAVLTPGSYMTTDGKQCYFRIEADGSLKEGI